MNLTEEYDRGCVRICPTGGVQRPEAPTKATSYQNNCERKIFSELGVLIEFL